MTAFATQPKSIRFTVERDLYELLKRHERRTVNIPVSREQDVLLNDSGLVQGKYSLSMVALKTLCSKLVPGLGQAMSSVVGLNQNESEFDQPRATSQSVATRWLNDAIRLRFDDINGFNMVVDHKNRRVEGFVGRSYQFFPNKELYENAREFLAQEPEPPNFWEAVLSGRRLLLRFRSQHPVFEVPITGSENDRSEPFSGGFHFANSEVGECSLRAAAVCIRDWHGSMAISPFYDGGKIAHVRGSQFERRFSYLLVKVRKRAEEVVGFRQEILRLIDTNLGLGGTKTTHERQCGKVTAKLNKKGLPARFSHAALDHALKFGSYKSQKLNRSRESMDVYASRTAYDLYNAVTYSAKSQDPELREKAEQIAYEILSGKITLN